MNSFEDLNWFFFVIERASYSHSFKSQTFRGEKTSPVYKPKASRLNYVDYLSILVAGVQPGTGLSSPQTATGPGWGKGKCNTYS